MVPPERDHDRHVPHLHRGAQLLRPDRSAGAVSPQEGHEVDAGEDHGAKSAQVSADDYLSNTYKKQKIYIGSEHVVTIPIRNANSFVLSSLNTFSIGYCLKSRNT